MATETSTQRAESGGKLASRVVNGFQHLGVVALLAAFCFLYSTLIVIVTEVFTDAGVFAGMTVAGDIAFTSAFALPIIIAFTVTFSYTLGAIAPEYDPDYWEAVRFTAGFGAIILPVTFYALRMVGV